MAQFTGPFFIALRLLRADSGGMTQIKETEAQRTRRRWITFGETVAVLALLISAASFWDAHQDHVRNAPVPKAATAPVALVLTASVADDGQRLDLHAAHADQVIETQTLYFPASVRSASVETTGNARIEAGWFEDGLVKAAKAAKPAVHRIAVGIETSYTTDGTPHTDRAIYDIGYTLHSRFLRGSSVQLEGISLVARRVGPDLRARVDARWHTQAPG